MEIKSVRAIPNNAGAEFLQDLVIKFDIDTTIRARDSLHDTYLEF